MRTKTDANQRICNIYLCGVTMTDTSSGPSQVDLPNGAQAPKDETMDEEDDLEKPVDFFNDECLLVWSIVPRLTGTFAWSIAVAFLFDCRFIYLDFYQLAVSNTTEPIYAEPLRFGLLSHAAIQMTHNQHDAASNWTIYNAEECLRYSTNLAATKEFATAQVCAIVTVVLGGILSWMLWIMYCCRFVCLCIPSIMISLGFLLVLPVLQGISIFMLRTICTYRLDEPPLQDLLQQAPNFEYTQQLSTCGMSSLYGLYYPVSIAMWIITGLLFLGIRPRKDNDLNAVAMLP